MTAYNYQTFENVPSAADQLSNIAMVAQSNGWTIDKDDIGSNGELYLHSTGLNGNQNLYFSLKIFSSTDYPSTRQALHLCCNTGYDGNQPWDNQPGRFSSCVWPYNNQDSGTSYTLEWGGTSGSVGQLGYWFLPNCPWQIVFANTQNIINVQRIIETGANGETITGYASIVIGAMDSQTQSTETELNFVRYSLWGRAGINCFMFFPYIIYSTGGLGGSRCHYFYPYGFLYNGENALTDLPDKNPGDSHYSEVTFEKNWFSSIGELRYLNTNSTSSTKYFFGYNDSANAAPSQRGPDFTNMLINNPGMARTVLHKPFIYVEDRRTSYHYFYPTRASLPYYACGFYPYLKGEQIISYGSRNFMVFPWADDKCDLGYAIEVNAT